VYHRRVTARADLEAAILAEPDAREAYAVYGDWLLEHGDPDGELVTVQLALEEAPSNAVLRLREAELVVAREEQLHRLYCYAVGRTLQDLVWRRGVLYAAAIGGDAYSDDNAFAYRELAGDPVARFLRELTVRPATIMHGEPTPGDGALVDAIAAAGAPRALRRLAFDPLDFQLSWTRLTDLSPIYPHLPRLEELAICAGDLTLGRVELPALRSLEIVTGGLRRHVLDDIAAASWPRLESLVLYLGTEGYGGECTVSDLTALLDGAILPPGVTTLGLCNCEFADELAEALARSRILPRLRRLDLSRGTLGDAGARVILDHADAFRHLAELDLYGNYLTAETTAELARLGPAVDTSGQQVPEDGERYVSIGE
jgi:uncharacterized protein (TIGR02996 family)